MNDSANPCGHPGTCADVRRRLDSLRGGACDPEESRILERHIRECPRCLEDVGCERALRQLLRRCCCEPAPVELRRRITTRIGVTYRTSRPGE